MQVALATSLILVACSSEPAELSGFVRTPLPDVAAVTLPDASNGGSEFSMRADAGELLLVYFGYTSCPDVCPTTLADVRSTLRELGDDAARIDVAMATVDPERDTDEVITGYVQTFVREAHGLRTTDDAALRAAADAFGAAYDVSISAGGDFEVIHTGHLYAVDEDGKLRLTWPFGTDRADLLSDLHILLDAQ